MQNEVKSGAPVSQPCCVTCRYESPEERYTDDDYWWEYYCNLAGGRKIERIEGEQCPPWCPLANASNDASAVSQ